jgi:hypothetical protein
MGAGTMSNFKSDLPYIKWGLMTLLVALGVSGTAVYLSQDYLDLSQLDHTTAERKLTTARTSLNTASDDQQNMASYAQEYAMLLQRHVIGKEQRLDWLDNLERLRHRNLVMDFTYAISPQAPYKPPLQLDTGNFDLMRSDMTLSFKLLHEGQLMAFLDALRSSSSGWFMLDGCSLTRNMANAGNGAAPQLKAECKGGWLTLKNRNKP